MSRGGCAPSACGCSAAARAPRRAACRRCRAWPRGASARPATRSCARSCECLLAIERQQPLQLVVGQLGDPGLAGGEQVVGDLALALEHLLDAFLERAGADELVHEHVALLAD